MSGIAVAVAGTFGGAGGGGGVSLSAVINAGEVASDFNNSAWTFGVNTCVASGGTPPYSYAWSYVSSSGGTWGFVGSSTVASVAPRVTSVAPGTGADAVLKCTVTDSAGVPVVVDSNQEAYFYENIF